MKILGIIPAKKYSSRLKNKNIRKINNKYLIEYTILNSLRSKVFKHILISSDSEKIYKICKKYDVVFQKRPKYLSRVNSNISDVILYVLKNYLTKFNICPDILVILEPTSPLRSANTIRNTIKLFKKKKINSIIPINVRKNLIAIKSKKKLKFINKKNINNSIKREKFYEINSLIWAVRTKYFLKTRKIFDENSIPFITNEIENFDINTEDDFTKLKKLFK